MGRITSDVVRGMSVTQFIGIGHIAKKTQKNRMWSRDKGEASITYMNP